MIGAAMLSAEPLEAELDRLAAADARRVRRELPDAVPRSRRAWRSRRAARAWSSSSTAIREPALVARAHEGGALVSWQVGSLAEALAAERAGCDFVVAQGTEAGGHVRGRRACCRCSPRCSTRCGPRARGGRHRDARAISRPCSRAVRRGARVGTRFVAAAESGAHPDVREGAARGDGRRHVPHRGVLGDVARRAAPRAALGDRGGRARGPDAIVGEIDAGRRRRSRSRASRRSSADRAHHAATSSAMALYAGESVSARDVGAARGRHRRGSRREAERHRDRPDRDPGARVRDDLPDAGRLGVHVREADPLHPEPPAHARGAGDPGPARRALAARGRRTRPTT